MKHWHTERVVSVSLCQPAVRMVVIVAVESADNSTRIAHIITPVVALRASVVRRFAARASLKPPEEGTEEELGENGWVLELQTERTQALAVLPESAELLAHDDPWCKPDYNYAISLVVCPWPPEEDEQRLAGEVRRVRQDVESRIRGGKEK